MWKGFGGGRSWVSVDTLKHFERVFGNFSDGFRFVML
jgi:hypothetical protein